MESGARFADRARYRVWRLRGTFTANEGSLRGVTRFLDDHVAYSYCYERATQGPLPPSLAAAEAGMLAAPGKSVRQPRTARGGARRGIHVDAYLGRVTEALRQHAVCVDLSRFLTLPPRQRAKQWPKELVALRRRPPPFALRLLHWVHDRNLVPVAAQLPVGRWSVLRLGTAIDLVCRDARTGEIQLLEVKCGFTRSYHRYSGNMAAPLQSLDNSPYVQHQLQMLLTTALFRYCFPDVALLPSLVVRVSAEAINVYPLEERISRHLKGLYQIAALTRWSLKEPPKRPRLSAAAPRTNSAGAARKRRPASAAAAAAPKRRATGAARPSASSPTPSGSPPSRSA